MNVVLNLSLEVEVRLKDQAAAKGQKVEEFIADLLTEEVRAGESKPPMLPVDQWNAKLAALLASTPQTNAAFVDDSRESIYAGRGE